MTRKIKEIDAQIESINRAYDEEVSDLFEPHIEGQRLERELNEKLGHSVRKPIVF